LVSQFHLNTLPSKKDSIKAMVKIKQVKKLRSLTGAGVMDCKRALEETDGNIELAVAVLRQRGFERVSNRDKETKAGAIASYVHNGHVGVLVEVQCETDFVARTSQFREFAHNICLQVAALNPRFISESQFNGDPEVSNRRAEMFLELSRSNRSAEEEHEKNSRRMDKTKNEECLLCQKYVKNSEITVKDYLMDIIARTGEKIVIKRFHRMELGK